MLIKPTGRDQRVLLAWRQSLYQTKSGNIKDRTIEANLKHNKKKQSKFNTEAQKGIYCLYYCLTVLSSDSLWILNFLSFEICTKISLRMWGHGGHLAGQNKETNATLEKLVNLISMKTKEYSIGSHFESSLNWAQNNTKSVEFKSRNNRKALLIQWNHTKEWPLSWYCVVYLVSFVSSNLCRIEEFINWC